MFRDGDKRVVYKLRPKEKVLAELSFDVKSMWALGLLSAMLNVSKKHLRIAFGIIKNPELEAEIMEKKKLVKKTFRFGFREFRLKKKGKERQILAPHPDVQLVFMAVKEWLEKLNVSHPKAFGFVKDKNPKKAMATLLGNEHFIGFDIADAFPSVTVDMVKKALIRLNVNYAAADVLAWFVTYEYDGQRRLPQGSSCSPIFLNFVYRPMCDEIEELCARHGVSWNVYADDFNVAGVSQQITDKLKAELLAVPAKFGFAIKEKKTRDNFGKTIPHVLGQTIVDGKVHIVRRNKNKIRRILFAARAYGAYTPEQVLAYIGYICHIYGEEANWPGGILKLWRQYQGQGAERGQKCKKKTSQ